MSSLYRQKFKKKKIKKIHKMSLKNIKPKNYIKLGVECMKPGNL